MHDEAITPPETAFVDEPDVIIQEYCPDEISDHMAESLDPECFAPLVNTLLYGETFRPQTHSTGPGVVDANVRGVGNVEKDPSLEQIGNTGNDTVGFLGILKHWVNGIQ